MAGRRPSSSFTVVQALIVAAIVLVSSFGVGVARLLWTEHNLRALEAAEQSRVDALTQSIADLEKQIAYAKTDDYVRDWARTVGKLIQPGEVPVVVVAPRSQTVTTTIRPASPAAPVARDAGEPRWRILLDRWFASPAP
ncbi:MAG: hypothetical protein KIS91_20310 [Anaerolineae bacterium]|nr:hypothetical protein [Anaerolineae bacterium]